MANKGLQTPQIILVLDHSFFHHAFRLLRPVDSAKINAWASSRFVANLIIERQTELPKGISFATTSIKAFDSFATKFLGEKPSPKLRQTVAAFRDSITVIDRPSVNKLSLDDGVLVICDTLYSTSNHAPILVSNIPKKIEMAEAFYHAKDSAAKIPYPIYDTMQVEVFLRKTLPELSQLVDSRIRIGNQTK